ncbi:chromosome partition protein [Acidianus ambivalens]|uniref:Chromosome partition protein n=1 Tax=Acidianus ambivalens TaxID=2283 RepID=A0A650CTD1_ACIAM|nr:chromosome partition protein [Acidianus ambivalens]MQL56444.1 chromosome partition protein [Acidianus ambivalens]QGR21079.1 chromosome partition protein [Acidianus ambivalens]
MNTSSSNTTETNPQTNKLTNAGIEKTVKQTSNKQTNLNPSNFYNITSLLAFRINVIAKQKYMELSPQKKKIVKLVLENAILSLAEDKENLPYFAKQLGLELAKNDIQPILNININYSEAKAEAKAEIDISKLLELTNELERIINWIETHNWRKEQNAYIVPPAVLKELNDAFAKIKRLVN